MDFMNIIITSIVIKENKDIYFLTELMFRLVLNAVRDIWQNINVWIQFAFAMYFQQLGKNKLNNVQVCIIYAFLNHEAYMLQNMNAWAEKINDKNMRYRLF